MVTSVNGRNIIKKYEGLHKKAYRCPAGVLTIGYGHTKGVKSGMIITNAQAEDFLTQDLATAEKAVNIYQKRYNFNQNEYDALVSFTFNLGAGNLNKLLQAGLRKRAAIADKIPAYNKSKGKVLNGLVKRRAEERQLFLTPVSANTSKVSTSGDYSKVFDATFYANKYSDLKAAFGTDANALLKHFLEYGMKERRQAIATFNVDTYLKYNADVLKAVTKEDGTIDYPLAYNHYCVYGYREGRRCI